MRRQHDAMMAWCIGGMITWPRDHVMSWYDGIKEWWRDDVVTWWRDEAKEHFHYHLQGEGRALAPYPLILTIWHVCTLSLSHNEGRTNSLTRSQRVEDTLTHRLTHLECRENPLTFLVTKIGGHSPWYRNHLSMGVSCTWRIVHSFNFTRWHTRWYADIVSMKHSLISSYTDTPDSELNHLLT